MVRRGRQGVGAELVENTKTTYAQSVRQLWAESRHFGCLAENDLLPTFADCRGYVGNA
jgi:hypothetical protein